MFCGLRWLPLVIAATSIGCVSSPEVKQASAAMTVAIDEYDQNIRGFRDLWVGEIEKTQGIMHATEPSEVDLHADLAVEA